MFDFNLRINLEDLKWSSDWNGEDLGYPEVSVVGYYTQTRDDGEYSFEIDMENNVVLDFWKDDDDDKY